KSVFDEYTQNESESSVGDLSLVQNELLTVKSTPKFIDR
ncbi:hypothetical protein Bhyg_07538, partial [Pseudolycoriella hygida]